MGIQAQQWCAGAVREMKCGPCTCARANVWQEWRVCHMRVHVREIVSEEGGDDSQVRLPRFGWDAPASGEAGLEGSRVTSADLRPVFPPGPLLLHSLPSRPSPPAAQCALGSLRPASWTGSHLARAATRSSWVPQEAEGSAFAAPLSHGGSERVSEPRGLHAGRSSAGAAAELLASSSSL